MSRASAPLPQHGSLYVRTGAGGREHWYAKWRVDRRLVNRDVGAERQVGERDGLTKPQPSASSDG